jgi:hypothetical protein
MLRVHIVPKVALGFVAMRMVSADVLRGGCTLAPDAYLFTVIDRAITAELTKCPSVSIGTLVTRSGVVIPPGAHPASCATTRRKTENVGSGFPILRH